MNNLATYLEPLLSWLDSLQQRERYMVIVGAAFLLISGFYLLIWDPVFGERDKQQQHYEEQRQLHNWMRNAAAEVKKLQSNGARSTSRFANQSISTLAERSAQSFGLKQYISKLESGNKGVKVTLQQASFDQMVQWLYDMQLKYNIQTSDIQIEPQQKPGAVNAKLTLERPDE